MASRQGNDNNEHLFDDIQETDEPSDSAFEIDLKPVRESDTLGEKGWDKDIIPAEWLLNKSGRASIVALAIEQIESEDPIYLNKSEIGERSGSSRYTAHRHMQDLVDIGIFEKRGRNIDRYRANANSTVLAAIARLNEEIADHLD